MSVMVDENLISLQPGTVIGGRYEVVKCLGAGSMGLVYACRHRELPGHMVAAKVLFPEVAQDKIAAARFRNEIFASYDVSHPNVVRAYEYLRDGDLVAYTMEYIGGGDLATKLSNPEEPVPIAKIVKYLSQICAGVQAIHDAGIVHRDLKPENILITENDSVKITDFGIARTGHGPRLTEHGGVVGTIDYVSPEYILNSQVDWRSDIYAVGILGYEMVTGESPFRGDSVYETMTKRLKSDPKRPSELRPDCPKELDQVILRAMERDPEKRYQSMAEMFHDLQPLLEGAGITSGALLSMSRSSAKTFIGPSVNKAGESGDAGASEASEFQGSAGRPASAPRYEPPRTPPKPNVSRVRQREDVQNPAGRRNDFEQLTDAPIPPIASPESTHVLNPEILEIATRYSESGEEESSYGAQPEVMESIFERRSPFLGRSEGVNIGGGEIDTNRIRTLLDSVEEVNRSPWIDFIILITAVLIGIGVGFVFLNLFVPGWMESTNIGSAKQGSEIRAIDEAF